MINEISKNVKDCKTSTPVSGITYLAFGMDKNDELKMITAKFIPKYSIKIIGDYYLRDSDYNENDDAYYWPEGWYECNEAEEFHSVVDFEITHFQEILISPVIPPFLQDQILKPNF